MKKYEKAKIEYVKLLTEDIMFLSFDAGEGGSGGVGEGGDADDNVM